MTTQIKLSAQQLAELSKIRDIGAEKLNDLVAHLKSLQPLPLRPDDLHNEVKKILGEVIEAESLLRPILALSGLIRQRALNVDEVIEGLRSGISTSRPEWTDKQLANWKSIEPQLRTLFEIPAVRVVTKATDLAYEYANLLKSARVITDIRPIFNDDATDIDASVISYTLRLNYDNPEGSHSLSIAMDESDIEELKRQCDRAFSKAQLSKDLMRNTAGIPTIITGEQSDE